MVDLLNSLGFETWWISNQSYFSNNKTELSVLVNNASRKQYLNLAGPRESTFIRSYDEKLLPALEEAMDSPAPRKVIFLHLMGSHVSYAHRDPPEFAKFIGTADIPDRPYLTPKNKDIINTYDNSVLYTDYIVSTAIAGIARHLGNNFAIYFSDHGEEIFDQVDMRGHNPNRPTASSAEIPFILWLSPEFKHNHARLPALLATTLDRPFVNDYFAPALLELLGVTLPEKEATRCLFHQTFAPYRRVVGGASYSTLRPAAP